MSNVNLLTHGRKWLVKTRLKIDKLWWNYSIRYKCTNNNVRTLLTPRPFKMIRLMDNSSYKEKLTMDKIRVKSTLTIPFKTITHDTHFLYYVMCIQSKRSDLYINNTSKPVEWHTNERFKQRSKPGVYWWKMVLY